MRGKLEGWEDYPNNLNATPSFSCEYNLASYCKQLRDESERLFISGTKLLVKVKSICPDVPDTSLEEPSLLDDYLADLKDDNGTRIILIGQNNSWSPLGIDESSIRKLMTRFKIFPPFIEILRSFGQRIGTEGESVPGIYLRSDQNTSVQETCYLVKQVEKHGRLSSGDPWSIRQTGVYHQSSGFSHTFIILNLPKSLRERLRMAQEHSVQPLSPQALHTLIISWSMENWRWYISALEKRYITMKEKAQLTRIDEKCPMADIRIEDTQEIQVLQDKCQQVAHILKLNRIVLQELSKNFALVLSADVSRAAINAHPFVSLSREASIHVERVENLLKRLDGTIALTRTILDFRCLASLEDNSHISTAIMQLAKEENSQIVELTRKASRDQDIVKWITFLTLVYLPASFCSSLMGMGSIKVDSSGKGFSIHIAGEFWVFFVLTAILLILTLVSYFWYIRHNLRLERKDTGRRYRSIEKV